MPKKILIVDDQQGIRVLLSEVMRLEGYEPLVAENGAVALALEEQNRPDAILLDVKIPGMDGIEILTKLRTSGSQVPVIMMTAYEELHLLDEARRLGIHMHFTKPFDISVVKESVMALLGEPGA